ncbi:MAG: DUF1109 domain-containing protein [Burkholderiales bacterium]|nr:DUF1109 domain-containing protein [Burkholderiales bacterium]
MKTEELVDLLAAGETRVPANAIGKRFAVALVWSIPLAVLIMVSVYGVRSDLVQAMGEAMFWVKFAFAGALALFAFISTERLGRPGMRVGGVWAGLAAPLLLLWLVAVVVIARAEPAQRAELIFGSTWKTCPLNIALISLPLFVGTLWFMKGLAPTQRVLAGASAGLFSGALATLIYALHCPESAAPFLGVWYVLGILIPTAAGALWGPRVLRW